MANVTGSFVATGQSASFTPNISDRSTKAGAFNVSLTGTAVATVQLEKSFDNGTTWCLIYGGGSQLYVWSYNSVNLAEQAQESEQPVLYRLNCTGYTSGTLAYRISQ
jgi:hypothetical protein